MAKQIAFHLDASTCTACKACMVACKDKNDLPVGVNWRKVYEYGGGGWVQNPNHPSLMLASNVFAYSVSVACMHCQDATCVDICPAGAMSKNGDGIVTLDAEKCIGCRYCEWACPYGAPQFNEALGVMTKCDMCVDLQAEGKNPACVDACPMRALEIGELTTLQSKFGSLTAIEPLPGGEYTAPSMVITPHKHSQHSGTGTGKIISFHEEA